MSRKVVTDFTRCVWDQTANTGLKNTGHYYNSILVSL